MSSAVRYNPHYTIADYEQWEGEWELWNGVAVAMSPSPTRRHQQTMFNLAMQIQQGLAQHEPCHCQLVLDVDWRVAQDTVVRPDLSVICTEFDSDYIYEAPTLIAEVLSPSTAQKDQNEKRRLYENQGVAWYLMVDPDSKTVLILRLGQQQYEEVVWAPTPTTRIELHEGCAFLLDRDRLFS